MPTIDGMNHHPGPSPDSPLIAAQKKRRCESWFPFVTEVANGATLPRIFIERRLVTGRRPADGRSARYLARGIAYRITVDL